MGLSAALEHPIGLGEREQLLHRLAIELESLRVEVETLIDEPAEQSSRERLAEQLRGHAADAASSGLAQLAEEISGARAIVQAASLLGGVSDQDRDDLGQTFSRIEAFLEAELGRELTPGSGAPPVVRSSDPGRAPRRKSTGSMRVALVTPQCAVDSLLAEDWAAEDDGPTLHAERVEEASAGHYMIRSRKPDVIVVDVDRQGAERLVERLVTDAETDAIPMIALGTWEKAEDAAQFIALGVARSLPKPVSPGTLRRACLEVGPRIGGFEPVGEVTLDGLGSRLASELHRSLCDAADDRTRANAIDMGDGAEVLTVLWDAMARIRELVTAQSHGAVRFSTSGSVASVPQAAWLTGTTRRSHSDRATPMHEVRRGGDKSLLQGQNVVVVEDDLSMNWFLAGVLREAGASVHNCYDGRQAINHAYQKRPDLVLSDVVMPEIDGYALCRRIKSDVLLRSVPVILLSWKQDLLQRMRELGAGADGYLLKEASSEEIMQRVLEVLRPRRSLADRIATGGKVRGRLDGLTVYDLLTLAAAKRPDCCVSVRDANYLYEVELRSGRPVLATRTNSEGMTRRGPEVMATLLGIGGGRFGITATEDGAALSVELEGTLDDQLLEPLAAVRASQALLTGPNLMRVERVGLIAKRLHAQLRATPEPSRGLLRSLIAGASPRELIVAGRAAADHVERVLRDAAAQGAVSSVIGRNGVDQLPIASDRELAVLSGEADPDSLIEPHEATGRITASWPPDEPLDEAPAEEELYTPSGPNEVAVEAVAPSDPNAAEPYESFEADEALIAALSSDGDAEEHDEEPYPEADEELCSEADERIEEVEAAAEQDGIAGPLGQPARTEHTGYTPVLASAAEVAEHQRRHTPMAPRARLEQAQLAQLDPSPVAEPPAALPSEPAAPAPAPAPEPQAPVTSRQQVPFTAADALYEENVPRLPRLPMPSAWATRGAEPPRQKKKSTRFIVPIVFGVIGISLAIGARWYREHQPPTPPPTPAPLQQQQPQQPVPAPLPPSPMQPGVEVQPPAVPTNPPIELPLSAEDAASLKTGQGLLEVVAGRDDKIFIDGKQQGKGPALKVPLEAREKPYEVRVKLRGEERVRYVVVEAGKRLRLRVAPPWSR